MINTDEDIFDLSLLRKKTQNLIYDIEIGIGGYLIENKLISTDQIKYLNIGDILQEFGKVKHPEDYPKKLKEISDKTDL